MTIGAIPTGVLKSLTKNIIDMKRFTLYMGLNDKDTKTQQISIVEAYKIVSNILASDF